MSEVKFIYTGYLKIEGTDNSMDTIEKAMETVRISYGNLVADYADFTIVGECEHDICDCNLGGESNE
jgi:hypothetical protein